jgi:hypothetical protein
VLNFCQGGDGGGIGDILHMMDISLPKKRRIQRNSAKNLQKIDSVNHILTIKRKTIIICIREDKKR